MKMIGKRGMSHVEIIIGVLMFIAVVIFAIILLAQNENRIKLTDKDFLKIENLIKIDTSEFYVLDVSGGIIEVNVSENSSNFSAINEKGELLDVSLSGKILKIKTNGAKSIRIISSKGISPNYKIISGSASGTYKTGTFMERKVYSQNKIEELEEEIAKFRIELKNESGVISYGKEIPKDLEVYKKSIKSELLYNNGEIKFINMEIYLW